MAQLNTANLVYCLLIKCKKRLLFFKFESYNASAHHHDHHHCTGSMYSPQRRPPSRTHGTSGTASPDPHSIRPGSCRGTRNSCAAYSANCSWAMAGRRTAPTRRPWWPAASGRRRPLRRALHRTICYQARELIAV